LFLSWFKEGRHRPRPRNIGAAIEQVGRKAVAQRMRGPASGRATRCRVSGELLAASSRPKKPETSEAAWMRKSYRSALMNHLSVKPCGPLAGSGYSAFTLEVIEPITVEAIFELVACDWGWPVR
jgi:hypothetical protein